MIEYLDRTILLMRDLVTDDVPDEELLRALTETRVLVVSDEMSLRRHSARVALATTAQLAARSGAQVFIGAPNVALELPMPPMTGTRLVDALVEVGAELLPGDRIRAGVPQSGVDVVVLVGAPSWRPGGELVLRVAAGDHDGRIGRVWRAQPWQGGDWPFGGLAAAGLAAAEIFKASLRRLRPLARNPPLFDEQLAPARTARLTLDTGGPAHGISLGDFDVVSAGAISQAALFCLSQVPGVSGRGRIVEAERGDISNMNRYMLLLRSALGQLKADALASLALGFEIMPVLCRFDEESISSLTPLRDRVIVGVDHIPSRWFVQDQRTAWLGIGGTSHFDAMSSWHGPGVACARCLHATDDEINGNIPTAAFVSFLAGLSVAARLVGAVQGVRVDVSRQLEWLPTLRLDGPAWRTPIMPREGCPLRCGDQVGRAA